GVLNRQTSAKPLPINDGEVRTGEALFSLSYPGGVDLLAMRLPEDARQELYKYGRPSTDEIASFLAKRGDVEPLLLGAKILAENSERIFYESTNNTVSPGGLLMNSRGKVSGFSEMTPPDYPWFNIGVSVYPMRPWIIGTISQNR